jgi:hypothetical protein
MARSRIQQYLLLLCICALCACSESNAVVYSGKPNAPSREELRQAMQHHGILAAKRDQDGQWYFVREGKRCALFAFSQPAVSRGLLNESRKN